MVVLRIAVVNTPFIDNLARDGDKEKLQVTTQVALRILSNLLRIDHGWKFEHGF